MSKIIPTILSVFLVSCIGVKTEKTSNTPLEMPPIVFMEVVDYGDVSEEYKVTSAVGFYDNKGNYYTMDNYIYSHYDKNSNKIFEKYKKGELNEDIKFQQKCDINELKENYKKLYKLPKKDKIKIVYPHGIPEVQTEVIKYYGFYYDKNKNRSVR